MRKVDDGKRKKKRKKREKNGIFSGHYVIASSLLPKRRPLEFCTLVPKSCILKILKNTQLGAYSAHPRLLKTLCLKLPLGIGQIN